eukprot:SAG11_NODE_18718_length_483_cov_0.919271_1_plen_98_part_01
MEILVSPRFCNVFARTDVAPTDRFELLHKCWMLDWHLAERTIRKRERDARSSPTLIEHHVETTVMKDVSTANLHRWRRTEVVSETDLAVCDQRTQVQN